MQHASVEDYTIALSESIVWLSIHSNEQFSATVGKFKCISIVLHYGIFCKASV